MLKKGMCHLKSYSEFLMLLDITANRGWDSKVISRILVVYFKSQQCCDI